MAYVITEPWEYLEVNSVPLSTPAWRLLNLSALLDLPPFRSSENEVIPGVDGRDPLEHFFDENTLQFEMVINGDAAPDGTPYDDLMLGWQTNAELLTAGLGFGLLTVEAIWHRRDGDEWGADVQVIPPLGPFGVDDLPNSVAAMLDVRVPTGRFVVIAS